jgi:hypothetical protein
MAVANEVRQGGFSQVEAVTVQALVVVVARGGIGPSSPLQGSWVAVLV